MAWPKGKPRNAKKKAAKRRKKAIIVPDPTPEVMNVFENSNPLELSVVRYDHAGHVTDAVQARYAHRVSADEVGMVLNEMRSVIKQGYSK
jgi:hypothetical protein